MLHNGLALNPSKCEVIDFDTEQALHKSNIHDFNVAGSVISVSDQIKSIGVVLDKRLSFDAQVDRTCKAIQYHARSFRHIRNSLPDILARTVASSIVSRLDYGNFLLNGTADKRHQTITCPEQHRAHRHWNKPLRPHSASAQGTALATCWLQDKFQSGNDGLQNPLDRQTCLPKRFHPREDSRARFPVVKHASHGITTAKARDSKTCF